MIFERFRSFCLKMFALNVIKFNQYHIELELIKSSGGCQIERKYFIFKTVISNCYDHVRDSYCKN